MYIAKDGQDYSGWVEEKRLKLGDHYGGSDAADAEPAPEQPAPATP